MLGSIGAIRVTLLASKLSHSFALTHTYYAETFSEDMIEAADSVLQVAQWLNGYVAGHLLKRSMVQTPNEFSTFLFKWQYFLVKLFNIS